ncbi:GM24617, partial [Drosophila sechellia]
HLPVLIMLWKTSWDSMPIGPRVTHIYILWLYCPQAQTPLMVSVDIGKNTPGRARRQVIQTCPSSETLENCDLLSDSPHFMRFTHREMKEHTGDYTLDIDLQLTILEDGPTVQQSMPNLNGTFFRDDDTEIELLE